MLFPTLYRTSVRLMMTCAALAACPALALAQARTPSSYVPRADHALEAQVARDREVTALPAVAAPAASTGNTTPLFRLKTVAIEGASALNGDRLASSYAPYIGRDVSEADLVALSRAISDAYRAAGFHLSRAIIPAQDLNSGHLRVQVIEGVIADIVVTGDEAGRFGLRPLLDPLTAEAPSRLSTLERHLLLAGDRTGLRITGTTLDEIGTATGRFRLTVSARTWHVFLGASTDNMGSRAVGPWQSTLAGALNSVIVPGDTLSLSGSFVPGAPHELRAGRIGYDVPIGQDGLRLGVAASRSEVRVGDWRRADRTVARSDTIELRASAAPVLTRFQSLWLNAAVGISDMHERDAFGLISSDRFGFASLGANYRLQLRDGSTTQLSATYRQGLGLIDGKPDSRAWLSRSGASPRFSLLNIDFSHVETLVENWSIRLAGSAQIASGPLLTSQQFYLGGQTFGRGFENGWLGGDSGIAGSAELRFDQKLSDQLFKGYQLFAFAEGGATVRKAKPRDTVQRLATVGGGVRLTLNDNLQFGIAVARPLSSNLNGKWDKGAIVLVSLVSALQH